MTVKSSSRTREVKLTCTMAHATCTWSSMVFCYGERSEAKAARTNTMFNSRKAHTKNVHTVCGRPTLKDVERFQKNQSANSMRDILKIYE